MSEIDRAEQGRVDAEVLREEGEVQRRIGEGGPNQHVEGNAEQGRVEAEEERVAAEEKRADTRSFYLKMATAIALPMAFIALIPSLVGIWLLGNETDNRTTENRKAIVYICSTTGVLNDLVVQVAESLKLNIDSGLYEQLVANGTLPPRAIKEANQNLVKYRKAHIVLSHTKPCTDLR